MNKKKLWAAFDASKQFDKLGDDTEREMFYEKLEVKSLKQSLIIKNLKKEKKLFPISVQNNKYFFEYLSVMIIEDFEKCYKEEYLSQVGA